MKKILIVCAVVYLLCGCSAAESGIPESESPGNDNPSPIPALEDIAFDDVEAVLFWQERCAEDKMYPLDDKGLEEALFDRLKQVRVTDRTEEKVTLAPTLKYDVCLKNGETVHIVFAGLYVEFGDGAYLYENCDKTVFPEDIRRISFDNADGQCYYEDKSDIEALMGNLTPTPRTESAEFKGDGVLLTFSILPRGELLEDSYVIEIVDVPICLYKSFFTLKTFLGTIGIDSYTQLETAKNGQFGTKLRLTVTSGGRTIFPASHFVCSTTYSASSGGMVAGDAFPRFEDYPFPEALTLSDDFTVWMKAADKTWYKLSRDGQKVKDGGYLTFSEFKGLESGIYQVEIYVTTNGRYLEELKKYEASTDVYYFLVNIE